MFIWKIGLCEFNCGILTNFRAFFDIMNDAETYDKSERQLL